MPPHSHPSLRGQWQGGSLGWTPPPPWARRVVTALAPGPAGQLCSGHQAPYLCHQLPCQHSVMAGPQSLLPQAGPATEVSQANEYLNGDGQPRKRLRSLPGGGWAVPLAEQEGPHLGTSQGSKAGTYEKAQGMVTRPLPHGWSSPCLAHSWPGSQGRAACQQAPRARGPRAGGASHSQ